MSYTLVDQLREVTQKALKRKQAEESKTPKELSFKEKADQFMVNLVTNLFSLAENGLSTGRIIMIASRSERLDEYEMLIKERCEKAGLKVEVKESWTLPPGDRESEGFYMYVSW